MAHVRSYQIFIRSWRREGVYHAKASEDIEDVLSADGGAPLSLFTSDMMYRVRSRQGLRRLTTRTGNRGHNAAECTAIRRAVVEFILHDAGLPVIRRMFAYVGDLR